LSDEVKKLAATSLVDPMMINQDDLDFKKAKQTLKDLPEFAEAVDVKKVETEKIAVTVKPVKAVEEKAAVAKKSDDVVEEVEDEETKVEIALPKVEKPLSSKIKSLDIPSQIQQNYVIAPAKQRLMILVSMLRHLATVWKNKQDKTPCKIMVFISSCDSVDFYHRLLNEGATKSASEAVDEHPRGMNLEGMDIIDPLDSDFDLSGSDDEEKDEVKLDAKKDTAKPRPVVPHLPVYKLHGNLNMQTRSTTTREFSSSNNSILLCTDVASRGLDVPNITHVIQFDPPTDLSDYAHRVGRTARIGKQGEATIFLLPSEVELLSVLEKRSVSGLTQLSAEKILGYFSSDVEGTVEEEDYQGGLTGIIEFMKQVVIKGKRVPKRKHYEIVATDVHMMMERYVLANKEVCDVYITLDACVGPSCIHCSCAIVRYTFPKS
jgi:ERCC4-related helicase